MCGISNAEDKFVGCIPQNIQEKKVTHITIELEKLGEALERKFSVTPTMTGKYQRQQCPRPTISLLYPIIIISYSDLIIITFLIESTIQLLGTHFGMPVGWPLKTNHVHMESIYGG